MELETYAGQFFKKIIVEIWYPDFNAGYKNISRIQYEVTYPDSKGNPTSRVQCWMDSENNSDNNSLQLAAWTSSSKYRFMRFDFLKNDKPDANIIISRTIYYIAKMSENALMSKIKISTGSEDARNFKVIDKSAPASVHNKIAITIGDLGVVINSPNIFETVF